MTLKSLCTPRQSVFAADRRATVLNLDTFLRGQVGGAEFFEENYFTHGMLTLVDRAFRHLGGSGAGSSVFLLSQAMGGGKTHSMIALGLLARDPALRSKVLTGEQNPAPKLGACRVAGFNGRSTDAAGGIWGSIAEQLGKAEQFARYVSPLLSAPGPEAWKRLLGGEPLVLFLDELPPYLEYAVAVPVGNADLGVVTTAALANLFVAVADMNTDYRATLERRKTSPDAFGQRLRDFDPTCGFEINRVQQLVGAVKRTQDDFLVAQRVKQCAVAMANALGANAGKQPHLTACGSSDRKRI